MKKTLKSIQKKHGMLNESYSWERTPGKALPTLADVQAKYNAKSVNEQVPGQFPSGSLEEQEDTSKSGAETDVEELTSRFMSLVKKAMENIKTGEDPRVRQQAATSLGNDIITLGKQTKDTLLKVTKKLGTYADYGPKL